MSQTPPTREGLSPSSADTYGTAAPSNLPCHVNVEKEREGRFRIWVYFAGRAFAVADPSADGAMTLDKAERFRDSLAESGANVSGLIAIPDELVSVASARSKTDTGHGEAS